MQRFEIAARTRLIVVFVLCVVGAARSDVGAQADEAAVRGKSGATRTNRVEEVSETHVVRGSPDSTAAGDPAEDAEAKTAPSANKPTSVEPEAARQLEKEPAETNKKEGRSASKEQGAARQKKSAAGQARRDRVIAPPVDRERGSSSVSGSAPPAGEPRELNRSSPETPASSGEIAGSQTPEKGPEAVERVIYVPYKDLRQVLGSKKAGVFVPYADYERLVRRALAHETTAWPVEAVIRQAECRAVVADGVAHISLVLSVQVLKSPWARLPVRLGKAAVGQVKCERGELVVTLADSGQYVLLFSDAGQQTVRMELSVPVVRGPDGDRFELRIPAAAGSTLDVTVPSPKQKITVTPAGVVVQRQSDSEKTRCLFRVGGAERLVVRWEPEQVAAPLSEPVARASNLLQAVFEGGLVHMMAQVRYTLLRGQLQAVRLSVPAEDRVLDVICPDMPIKDWRLEPVGTPGTQMLVVEFFEPVRSSVTIEVRSQRSLTGEATRIGGLDANGRAYGVHPTDVVHETGRVVLTVPSEAELLVEKQEGLYRSSIEELPAKRPLFVAGNSTQFVYYDPHFELVVRVRPLQPRLTVKQQSRFVFGARELKVYDDLTYSIERVGVFELKLKVPVGLSIDAVTGEAVKSRSFDAGSNVLTVSLNKRMIGQVAFTVVAHRELPPDEPQEVALTPLQPLNAVRETGTLVALVPAWIELTAAPERLKGVEPVSLTGIASVGEAHPAAAWTYTRRPVEVVVQLRRRPTRLSARVGTVVEVEPELVRVTTNLAYVVQYAPLRTLRLAVPEAVADRVQIQPAGQAATIGLRQKMRESKLQNGWVVWTVELQRPAEGTLDLQVSYDLPAEAGEQILVQPVQPLGLEKTTSTPNAAPLVQVIGEMAIKKSESLSVTAVEVGEGLEPIDIRELKLLPRQGALAFRYFTQPVALKLKAVKRETQPVVSTVVQRALVEVVVGLDQTALYRCRFRLTSSERQRLALQLPAQLELLGVAIDGKRTQMELAAGPAGTPSEDEKTEKEKKQAADDQAEPNTAGGRKPSASDRKAAPTQKQTGLRTYLVNVTRMKSPDEPFGLTLQFRSRLNEPLKGGRGELRLLLPQVGMPGSRDVLVQQTRVVLWIPPRVVLAGASEGFTPARPSLLAAVLGLPELRDRGDAEAWVKVPPLSFVDFPTEGRSYQYRALGQRAELVVSWWDVRFHTWVWTIAFVLVALVLRPTSWENKLGVLLLVAVAGVLYALRDTQAALQWLYVVRFGLAAMLGLWVIHGLFGWRKTVRTAERPGAQPPSAPVKPGDKAAEPSTGEPSTKAERPTEETGSQPVPGRPKPEGEPETGEAEQGEAGPSGERPEASGPSQEASSEHVGPDTRKDDQLRADQGNSPDSD